ncbi:GTPase Era [Robbsia andropogonis]|uniref:GTPase Era n=1 Tax=Robbsia andropogonis TaxID=28092 RepID=UPI0004B3B79A
MTASPSDLPDADGVKQGNAPQSGTEDASARRVARGETTGHDHQAGDGEAGHVAASRHADDGKDVHEDADEGDEDDDADGLPAFDWSQAPKEAVAGFRCGTVAIIGRPNVGKSTLMNAMVGQKVSITSRKAQTTRHRITGIQTLNDAQYIFIDTPGFQTRHSNALNRTLNRTVTSTLATVDVILLVVEAGRFQPEDKQVLDLIPPGVKVVLVTNKIDRVKDKQQLLPFLAEIQPLRDFTEVVPMSAKDRDDIKRLLGVLRAHLPEGEPIYDEEAFTDRSERFMAAEIVREKVFRWTGDEIPYTSTVVIDKFETEGRLRRIFVTILIARDTHKPMIIGQKGAKLKQISTDARLDMEKLFDGPVYLEVWVKVKSNWADNEAGLRAYGYD